MNRLLRVVLKLALAPTIVIGVLLLVAMVARGIAVLLGELVGRLTHYCMG